MNFMENLKNDLDNTSYTENGALGYKSTNDLLVDFNFKLPSYRGNVAEAVAAYKEILKSGNKYAIKYLFYLRDCREGLGERNTFRNCLKYLLLTIIQEKQNIDLDNLLTLIPEYGRWDDLILLADTDNTVLKNKVLSIIKKQLNDDLLSYANNEAVSLLAKWLPSDNCSSKDARRLAGIIKKYFHTDSKAYRRILKKLRAKLNITEQLTCSNKWSDVNYNIVPSKANLLYKDAFLRHDEERRNQFLQDLQTNKENVKINSKVNFPYDIVKKYKNTSKDDTLEELWKNLKQLPGLDNTLVVRDGSGSMYFDTSSNVRPIEVADSIAIYCAERCKSYFKDTFITFSAKPEFVDLKMCNSLYNKLKKISYYNDWRNTNLNAVFDLILRVAKRNKMKQDDLPAQILIVSDMEFDSGVDASDTLLETISKKFTEAGYKLPKLVFWNVASRTNTIPVTKNDLGFLLVSGFSTNILNMINSGILNPSDALLNELNKDRYKNIPLYSNL